MVIRNSDGTLTVGEIETDKAEEKTENLMATETENEVEVAEEKPRNKGGRPRKN